MLLKLGDHDGAVSTAASSRLILVLMADASVKLMTGSERRFIAFAKPLVVSMELAGATDVCYDYFNSTLRGCYYVHRSVVEAGQAVCYSTRSCFSVPSCSATASEDDNVGGSSLMALIFQLTVAQKKRGHFIRPDS